MRGQIILSNRSPFPCGLSEGYSKAGHLLLCSPNGTVGFQDNLDLNFRPHRANFLRSFTTRTGLGTDNQFALSVALVSVQPCVWTESGHLRDAECLVFPIFGGWDMNSTLPIRVVIYPTPAVIFPYGTRKWAVVGEDNWTPYRAYLLGHLRTSPSLKKSQPPQTGLHRC
ncbi:hypothetical protein AVEN_110739-1 [Araneus ventricosus]|uniref:Uncharacterized protein n=1 Tax=Araneus ventricosus TaxID=182803 RepID=A0A4Y2U1V0_ARAVE|nr:hypothetical protein AVEN_110739-1 [Araneus ventricosus]